MDEGRTERARQILQAIDNGNLPVEEVRRRLFAMLEEELAGPLDQDYDKVKVELCESLLWESMTDGETPLPDWEKSKAAVERKYEARKRRGRILTYGLRVAALALAFFIILTAAGVMPPIRWFTGKSTEDEQHYVVEGHEIVSSIDSSAVANVESTTANNHLENATKEEMVEYLGFDPGLPEVLAGNHLPAGYDVTVYADRVSVKCQYRDRPASEAGGAFIAVTLSVFTSKEAAEAYFQNEIQWREPVRTGGTEVYRQTADYTAHYMWMEENTLVNLHTDVTGGELEALVEEIAGRRGERPEERPADQPEDTGIGREIDGAVVAEVIARHGETGSLSTSDRAELTAFLGFDPGYPLEIGDGWDGRFFSAVIMPEKIVISCQYYGGEPDGQRAALRLFLFTNTEQTLLTFEQDSEGEYLILNGVPVYRLFNSGHTAYLWMRDNELYMLSLNSTGPETENVFRGVMAWRWGERPEEQPVEQSDDTGASHEIDGDVVTEVIERHGETGSLTTSDRAEWVAFLGVDPWMPEEIGDGWKAKRFDAAIVPYYVKVLSVYYDIETGEQKALLWTTTYLDMNDAYVAYEQDGNVEYLDYGGQTVCTYTNAGRRNYLWLKDTSVNRLTFMTDGPETENVFREVMAWWRGAQPEQ